MQKRKVLIMIEDGVLEEGQIHAKVEFDPPITVAEREDLVPVSGATRIGAEMMNDLLDMYEPEEEEVWDE